MRYKDFCRFCYTQLYDDETGICDNCEKSVERFLNLPIAVVLDHKMSAENEIYYNSGKGWKK